MKKVFEQNQGSKIVTTLAFNFMPNFEALLDKFPEVLVERIPNFAVQLQLADKKADDGKKRVLVRILDEEQELPILAFAAEDGVRIGCERMSYDVWRRIAVSFLAAATECFVCGQSARIRHIDLQLVLALSRDDVDHYLLLRDHFLRPGSIPSELCQRQVMDLDLEGLVEYPEGHRTRFRITSTQTEKSLSLRQSGQQVDPTDDLIIDIACGKASFRSEELSNSNMVAEFYENAENSIAKLLRDQDIGGPVNT